MRGSAFWMGLLIATATGPAPLGAADLVAHRAAYGLSLGASSPGSAIGGVRGGLVLEARAGCDGWTTNQRLGFVAEMEDGSDFAHEVRFSSWEAADGTRFAFNVRTLYDGTLTEEVRGHAELGEPAGAGSVTFQSPSPERLELPAGTLFPTEHLRQLLEAARAGERFVAHDVFDGSGLDGLNRISAAIGSPREDGEGERSWPVSLAYYPLGGAGPTPEFELGFALAPGGVVREITLDYGEFTLKGELETFERLPEPSCE